MEVNYVGSGGGEGKPLHSGSGKNTMQLFEWIEEGFVSADVIRDHTGTIIDWRYVDVNTAAQKNAGLRASDLIGRLASETTAGLDPWWLQSVRYVMETQQSEHLEQHVQTVARWFEITMFPFGPDSFGVLYYDITVKKRRDLDSAFLNDVSNELLNLKTPKEMIRAIGELIGEYLKVFSCSFAEIDEVNERVSMLYRWTRGDGPAIKETFRLKDFVSDAFNIASRAGQLFIVDDTASDSRTDAAAYVQINVGAVLAVPYIRDGRWVATAAVTSETPRHWLDEEIALFQEVTNKVFSRIERADAEEALRRSEEKYRMLFESIDEGFCLIEMIYDETGRPVDWRYLDANPAFERRTGKKPIGRKVSELVPKVTEARLHFLGEVARTRMPSRMEDRGLSNDHWFNIFASPVGDTGNLLAVIFDDITERKLGEKILLDSEKAKSFLLRLTDALQPLAAPIDIQGTVTRLTMEYFDADRCFYCELEGSQAVIRRDAAGEGLHGMAGNFPLDALPILRSVIAAGKPFVVRDVESTGLVDESSRIQCIQLKVSSFMSIPVIKDGRPAGVLCTIQSKARGWTDFEIDLAAEVAERTWTALERVKAERQLAKDLEDMLILQQISNRLLEESGIQSLYDAILDSAIELMNADFATVQAVIPGKNELYLLAYRNLHPDSVRHWQQVTADATSSCSHALMTHKRVIVQDLEHCPFELSKDDYDAYHLSGVASMQTTPLLSRTGKHVGMLSTGWKRPHTPSVRDLNVLDVVARQAADIIEQKQTEEVSQ